MEIISHRGNLEHPNQNENCPIQIKKALMLFRVEVDVWSVNGRWFLGHDSPSYEVDINFFDERMFLHCKNFEAVKNLSKTCYNWFWHEEDRMTLTSLGEIWCYPDYYIENGITVIKKDFNLIYKDDICPEIKGICTDYPLKMMEMFNGL